MTEFYIVDRPAVTQTDLREDSVLEIQRVASATLTEKIDKAGLMRWLGGYPPYISGRYYTVLRDLVPGTGGAMTAGSARFHAFIVTHRVTLQAIGIRVNTAGTNAQCAIYANNYTTGRPTGTPLAATANIDVSGAAGLKTGAVSVTLDPGVYWFGVNGDNSAMACTNSSASCVCSSTLSGVVASANVLSAATNSSVHLSTPLTFGTWGDLTGATWTEQTGTNFATGVMQVA